MRLFVRALPQRLAGTRLLVGLDTSSILRPDALTSPDRTLVYRPNLPSDATPVGPGWCFSTLVVLPDPVSSWIYILHRAAANAGHHARMASASRAASRAAMVRLMA